MICKRCNEEIEDGRVYCTKCGLELDYVPEYSEVEEELDKNILNLEEVDGEVINEAENDYEEYHLEKQITVKEKKIQIVTKIVLLSLAIFIMLGSLIAFFVVKNRHSSFSYQLKKGINYSKNDNYSKAVISFENAYNEAKSKEQKEEVSRIIGLLYSKNKDYKNTIYYLEAAVDNGCTDTEAITALVKAYELEGDSDSIKKLAKVASNDKTYKLFEKYLLNQPVFNYKSGTYNEYLNVEITSDDNETIYYTLDSSKPTTESNIYTGPIEVKDGKTIIHAITVNQNNLVSQEVVVTYIVQSAGAIKPEISPDSGIYTDFTKVTIDDISANCKIYYTTDGTDPTENSTEYKEPFDMPIGNHVIKAVSINTQTKVSSEVVSKIYDLDISGKYETAKASNLILSELYKKGELVNESGALADGTSCVLQFEEEVAIAGNNYYIMHRFNCIAGQMIDSNTYYAVDITRGNVFLAIKTKEGIYNLDSL